MHDAGSGREESGIDEADWPVVRQYAGSSAPKGAEDVPEVVAGSGAGPFKATVTSIDAGGTLQSCATATHAPS